MSGSPTTAQRAARSGWRVHAWRVLTTGTRLLAQPTSGLRAMPDFLIIGAQRAGTTSLHRYLLASPAVVPPRLTKGVHYFDVSFDRSFAWYRSHFPTRARMRRAAARTGGPAVTGEGSPYYLFHPLAADRIAAALPEVKLLVVLRDPVTRAWSHYHHEVARGFETLPFADALDAEPARLAGEVERMRADVRYVGFSHQHHAYVGRGRYLEQLLRYERVVAADQMLVLETTELRDDAQAACDRVADFLGIPQWSLPVATRHNTRSYPQMPAGLRERLARAFADDNERLFAHLGVRWPWTPAFQSGPQSVVSEQVQAS